MTAKVIRRGRALFASVIACSLVIVGALWLRSETIDATTERICAKVDALTAALVFASREGRTPTREREARIDRFVHAAACDHDRLEQLLKEGPPHA